MKQIGIYTSRVQKLDGNLTMTICRDYPDYDSVIICDAVRREDGDFEQPHTDGRRVNVRTISVEEMESKGEYICYASINLVANDGSWYKRLDLNE